jgi:predicted transcriptional regulator
MAAGGTRLFSRTSTDSLGMDVLLSIHPYHAARIFDGVKRTEFRRVRVRCVPPVRVWIYETAPVGMITGSADLAGVTEGPPAELLKYELDLEERPRLASYLSGSKTCSALHLDSPVRFSHPMSLSELGIRRPPQSYQRLGQL